MGAGDEEPDNGLINSLLDTDKLRVTEDQQSVPLLKEPITEEDRLTIGKILAYVLCMET